uniref:Putative LOC101239236 [Hydra vulgaris] n=1 Tax=Lepeophtheirus salmonis TaxID=72036 RepID=A0A0K2U2S5_LEPSM
MKDTLTTATLRPIFHWFSRFGFLLEVHADNCPPLASELFKTKLFEWEVTLFFYPPYHPQ